MGEKVPQSTGRELLLWLLRRRKRFRVTGASMLPTLAPGDEVLVDLRAYQDTPPQVGDVVLLHHPVEQEQKVVKRVTAVTEDGRLSVHGDNPAQSSDSRTWGTLPTSVLIGRVTCRFF